ncbi:MAG: 4-demethylwyosine synthase TYW1 [Candidatus Aenigmarchaeota archaeon]|nr:4-demethylwyosine synthase TYW1 [Candidatus Aenigmarchaeota archaeon]
MIPEKVKEILEKQQYRIVGKHSAVKICHWTKQSLVANRVCYKEKWYPPVQSHRCMQMTPFLGCNFHCLHCWRIHSGDRPGLVWKEFPVDLKEFDGPRYIIEQAIEKRKELLSGFKGNPNVDKKKFEEALKPTMMTASLTGEPTLYPNLSDLVEEARKMGMIMFIVTNGSMPELLENMDNLPFQLYVSVYGPDKETFMRLARPMLKDAWERLNRTLELLPSLDTRKVFRITAVKGWNMKNAKGYAEMIEKAEPNFVEIKSYEWVGESQKRLPMSAMPFMEDIRNFAKEIAEETSYYYADEFEPSGVVLLTKKKMKF